VFGRYGGRGIVVCKRWLCSYETFLADMGRKPSANHSLDRIDNDGDYEPSNCRWATTKEQNGNRSNVHKFTHAGETLNRSEWAARAAISPRTLGRRLARGLTFADAIGRPSRNRISRRILNP